MQTFPQISSAQHLHGAICAKASNFWARQTPLLYPSTHTPEKRHVLDELSRKPEAHHINQCSDLGSRNLLFPFPASSVVVCFLPGLQVCFHGVELGCVYSSTLPEPCTYGHFRSSISRGENSLLLRGNVASAAWTRRVSIGWWYSRVSRCWAWCPWYRLLQDQDIYFQPHAFPNRSHGHLELRHSCKKYQPRTTFSFEDGDRHLIRSVHASTGPRFRRFRVAAPAR